jgi:3-dehydroquinate synthase
MARVRSADYDIVIGEDCPRALRLFLDKHKFSGVFIICDENTIAKCLPQLIIKCPQLSGSEVIELESGENSKSIQVCEQVWQTLLEANAGKDTLIVNLGGGVVSDTGGFCASVYKRGVPFINIPTTLLAMADASVGGKTGINCFSVKNSVGTITQPAGVFIDPAFLKTLPVRHYLNGLAEIYKMALISNMSFWKKLSGTKKLKIGELILKSVKLKNEIVVRDPLDKGIRKILNFGHTTGHAIESASLEAGGDILHGEAVVAGMMIESHLSMQKKLISRKTLDQIIKVLKGKFGLIPLPQPEQMLRYLKNDKKIRSQQYLLPLINGTGSCKIDVPVSEEQIMTSILFIKELSS